MRAGASSYLVVVGSRNRQQQTDVLPLGDAIELYIDSKLRRRKPMPVEKRAVYDRLILQLGEALNAFEVKLTMACEFTPGMTFVDLADEDGDGRQTVVDSMIYGAVNDCCGIKKAAPADPAKKRKNPLSRR